MNLKVIITVLANIALYRGPNFNVLKNTIIGNHAQGVALAAKMLGISAIIAMPTTTPKIKVSSY